jgi:hypothetical protein
MKVYLYLLDTLADWEIGFNTAELNSKRYFDKSKEPPALIKIGNTKNPVKTMGGIEIFPEKCIDDIIFTDNDMLILPGGDTWMNDDNQQPRPEGTGLLFLKGIAVGFNTLYNALKGGVLNPPHE